MDLNSIPSDPSDLYEEDAMEFVPSTQLPVSEDHASDEGDGDDEEDNSQPNASKKRDLWRDAAVEMLVEQYCDVKVNKLQLGNFRIKDYAAIALRINESLGTVYTGKQVKNKVECLVKKYKKEKDRESRTGSTPSEWEFFDQFDAVLGESSKVVGLPGGSTDTGFRSGTKRKQTAASLNASKANLKTKKFCNPTSVASSQAPVSEYVVMKPPETSKSAPVYLDDSDENDEQEPGVEVDSPPAKQAPQERKKSGSSLRGKKTKARRNEEGAKAAATILAQP